MVEGTSGTKGPVIRHPPAYRSFSQPYLKDRKYFHTPAGTVGPLERGLIKATNSGENFEAWIVGKDSRILL
jgi:hypothetical protein